MAYNFLTTNLSLFCIYAKFITFPFGNLTSDAAYDVDQSLNFSWSIPADTGTIQSSLDYTIEFSNDISFSAIVLTSTSPTNTYQHSFTVAGNYYWRVKAKDAAGNTGGYSPAFKLIIE